MASNYDYDLITIGAGSGGVRASRLAAGYGHRVAVIEESRAGGTCVIRGCVPKKLLIYGAHVAEDLEDAEGYGWHIGDNTVDWARMIETKDKEINRLEGVYQRILKENGAELIAGRGTVIDPHTVEVNGERLTTERILIAVGSWPNLPDIPGIEHVMTSNEALDLKELPERMVIVGGGYIAVEFAGIYNALGVDVTVIVRGTTILRGFDHSVRSTLASEMEKRGITILRETQVKSIAKEGDTYSLRFSDDSLFETGAVMYATGRKPNTQGLGLENAGVELDRNGAIKVDEWSRSSVDSIFAVGDVTDRINLTPVALNEGRCFAETEFNGNPMKMDHAGVPAAVFSMPPCATVGLTEEQARESGAPVDIYLSRFKPMKHTLSGRDERTMMKLVVDRESDEVLGVHMVGMDAPEIMQGFGVALKCGATKKQFDSCVGIHPSAAEEFVTMREPLAEPSPEHTD